ncbi:hypothetical protein PR202_gb08152 [Eleusine coracana subsp. coracana]|uniref:Uncharacterized protein n=1 Tax=Eleusine coracana subsp. coracana TaxID=191504 RepID=A0AAV5ECA1_ELECO|nr:hypothetical protein PR202_gb08152 [Eleusine coracana subsp. coracana]
MPPPPPPLTPHLVGHLRGRALTTPLLDPLIRSTSSSANPALSFSLFLLLLRAALRPSHLTFPFLARAPPRASPALPSPPRSTRTRSAWDSSPPIST